MGGRGRKWDGSISLITGGASGIGRSLAAEMGRGGAHVVLADCDHVALEATAKQLADDGLDVSTTILDVTDRAGFAAAVEGVVSSRGRLDVLVNSAGISMGGPTHELTGAHWDRTIGIDLGGVVNGVLAAYPHMVDVGRGQIVNIASAAGLSAPPFVAPYAAAKHAVVGLSLSMRPEAARHGVRINVVCPGAVETPILDRMPPSDLPALPTRPLTPRAYLDSIGQRPVSAERVARAALRQVARNKPIVVVPAQGRAIWMLQRLSPSLTLRAGQYLTGRVQRELRQASSGLPAAEAPSS